MPSASEDAKIAVPRWPVFLCRHGERVDYAAKAAGKNWQTTAARPWDTPLTSAGWRQAAAAGRAINRHCQQLGYPPVSAVYSSPLRRAAETAAVAAAELGVLDVSIEPALVETMCSAWYLSWVSHCIHGSNI